MGSDGFQDIKMEWNTSQFVGFDGCTFVYYRKWNKMFPNLSDWHPIWQLHRFYFLRNIPNNRYLVHFDSHIWLLRVFILLFCSRSEGRSPLSLFCILSLLDWGHWPLSSSCPSSALGSPWQLYPSWALVLGGCHRSLALDTECNSPFQGLTLSIRTAVPAGSWVLTCGCQASYIVDCHCLLCLQLYFFADVATIFPLQS